MNNELQPSKWKSAARILAQLELCKNMKAKCIQYLLDNLNLSNACSLLEVSKTVSVPLLYQRCLEICTEAAFAILDSEDFDQVSPSTVTTIVSQVNLNADETDVLHALWIRATIDCCRKGLDPVYENILKFFKVYSVYVHFKGVDKQRVDEYSNDKLSKYYKAVIGQESVLNFSKRKFRKPVNIDSRLFCGYIAGSAELFVQLKQEPFELTFAVLESAYLIELTYCCASKAHMTERGLKYLIFKSGNRVLHEERSTLNLNFEEKNYIMDAHLDHVRLYECHFTSQNAIKLCPQTEYRIIVEPSSQDLLWPVITKFEEISSIRFLSSNIACLVGIKLIKSP